MYKKEESSIYNIIRMEQGVRELFSTHEGLTPHLSVGFSLYHDHIRLSAYTEVTVYVKDVDEVPYVFIKDLEATLNDTIQGGELRVIVESTEDDDDYYDYYDYYDSDYEGFYDDTSLEVWDRCLRGDESSLIYPVKTTNEEDTLANKHEWPFFGEINIDSEKSRMYIENNGRRRYEDELGYYKGLTESLNKLLKHFGSQEIDYKVIKQVDKSKMLDKLSWDIQYLKESITKKGRGYISELYSKDTYELHRELVLYYDLGLKQAYFSYNTLGYNYQWNTANSNGYKGLNYAAKYHLNDLSWKGLSSPGWQTVDSSGRCERTLHDEPSTFTNLQLLFEEELGSLFSLPEWRINRGDGSGVVFTLDVLVEGDITEVKESYKQVLYLNAKGEIVASISGYKKLNIEEGKTRINELRKKIGIQ